MLLDNGARESMPMCDDNHQRKQVWGTRRKAQTNKINILMSILFHLGDH
jgi:hypothetical protein